MYYHASPIKGIRQLEPRISNHGIPLVYFSKKRENVLVYLSNAIEKYCKETDFPYDGKWQKWGPYGFNKDGAFCGAQRQLVRSPTAVVRRSAAAGMLRGPQRPLVRWPTAAERW